MKGFARSTRLVLVVLAALLALPIAETASPVGAQSRSRTVTRTFRNTDAINLPTFAVDDPVPASNRYPSVIAVDGLRRARIRDVNLRLNSFDHTYPDDVQVLLVGPKGQTAIVLANVGGGTDVSDVTLELDDEAQNALPDETALRSRTFRPTNATGQAIAFQDPAPPASANAALSVFDGTNPNGTWRLFVQDEYGPTDPGAFNGGWTLEIKARVRRQR